ncbi:MAG: sugar O-acetyltransferase [Bacilli bacterium]|jgi:maltose O-acetyltransferase|nr:sugar O-acetyltransferase [Bacilli bacterium]
MGKEYERMIAGKIYDASDSELVALRGKAHDLCREYNLLGEGDPKRRLILADLLGEDDVPYLQGPIQFDYGINAKFGKHSYANFNFVVLDVCPITVGDNVFMGPNVSLVTPMHPLLSEEREMFLNEKGVLTDEEYAKPIAIGSDCWFGSNVTVCGGVTIGSGSVIGAGSVVVRDIPSGVLAAGNPCRVIRKITAQDSIRLKKGLR